MSSTNDVRDILSLPSQSLQQASQSQQRRGGNARSRAPRPARPKVDGITRELYALLGDNAPSLAIAQQPLGGAGQGFRPKFKRRPAKAQKWDWAPFKNPAREDDLILHHWVRKPTGLAQEDQQDESAADSSSAPSSDYKFAQFNTSSGVYSYSSEEYSQHLRDDDWTKEETDYLIDLCNTYDLRFVIISDRYSWPGKERSMEDIKARYYAICRRLIRSRISTDDMEARSALLQTYTFDRAREVERKRYVARLFTRTPAQLAEEEALYVEARRLEQNEARFSSEREELLRLLGGWESLPHGGPSAVAAAGAGLGVALQGGTDESGESKSRKKRKSDVAADETPAPEVAPPRPTGGTSGLSSKQKAELKQAQFDELHCISRFDPNATPSTKPPYPQLIGVPSSQPPVAPSPANPTSSHGVYLRSARLLAPRPPLAPRTVQTLAELAPAVGPRLVFPTARNAERWEGLLGAVTAGLEMKRQVDRVESELRIAKARFAASQPQTQHSLSQSQQAAASSSSSNAQNALNTSTVAAASPGDPSTRMGQGSTPTEDYSAGFSARTKRSASAVSNTPSDASPAPQIHVHDQGQSASKRPRTNA